jgi:DNA-binding Lrp family transcriptional regulator
MAKPRKSAPPQLSPKKRALMEVLDATARHGKVCPGLAGLAKLLGVSATTAMELLRSLRGAGLITWITPYCGTGLGKVRIVTIVATGQTTAKPETAWRRSGAAPKPQRVVREDLERAKTALRRRGCIVFDAEVTDGLAGRGFVKVDGRNISPADVIRQAAAIPTSMGAH